MSLSTFFGEFDAVSAKAWKQQIQYELKGADYNESLVWESPEGIKVKPFYHPDDNGPVARKGITIPKSWKIGEHNYVGDAVKSNLSAVTLLKYGVESLIFTIPNEDIDLEKLLTGIDLSKVPIHMELQFLSPTFVKKVLDLFKENPKNCHLLIDPIGHLARSGNWHHNLETDFALLKEIFSHEKAPAAGNSIAVDVSLYQNAGATMVQQLAYALAHANEYLNLGAPGNVCFKVAVGGNYFFEIAKLRALRLLWRTLANEYGLSADCDILVVPSLRNKTVYAYNTNMLRTTTECMSAILGGADTLSNLPYDALYHKNNEFGDRLARNQLLLLKHESGFDTKDDPAAGNYYIENLTDQLAEKALLLFKTLESEGGFLRQLKTHTIQRKIKESAQKEQLLFDKGQKVLVGTNKYQHQEDVMKDHLELYPFVKTLHRKT
ncbi:MAG: methylmalonyl-CoA mutase subunit beta, partial [Flavobacteriaceae bacterium]